MSHRNHLQRNTFSLGFLAKIDGGNIKKEEVKKLKKLIQLCLFYIERSFNSFKKSVPIKILLKC